MDSDLLYVGMGHALTSANLGKDHRSQSGTAQRFVSTVEWPSHGMHRDVRFTPVSSKRRRVMGCCQIVQLATTAKLAAFMIGVQQADEAAAGVVLEPPGSQVIEKLGEMAVVVVVGHELADDLLIGFELRIHLQSPLIVKFAVWNVAEIRRAPWG